MSHRVFLYLIFTISRPRFWLYLAGPFLIGSVPKFMTHYSDPAWYLLFIFFLIPANIFLYGINDYYDHDTDLLNPKKQTKEHLLSSVERHRVQPLLIVAAASYIIPIALSPHLSTRLMCLLLLFLSYGYSAPPLRFKRRPIIDSLSNALYIIPGIIGYSYTAGALPDWRITLACVLWASAMHLFSAVPDIFSDRAANLTTTAVYFGKQRPLIICSCLWIASFIFATQSLLTIVPWSIPLALYPLLPLYAIYSRNSIMRIYWWFPFINMLNGLCLYIGSMLANR